MLEIVPTIAVFILREQTRLQRQLSALRACAALRWMCSRARADGGLQ